MRKEFVLVITALISLLCGALLSKVLLQPNTVSLVVDGDAVIVQTKQALEAGMLVHAYDLWLIAANAAPANENLIITAAAIIKKARTNTDDQSLDIAASLQERLLLLLPYQKPENVEHARKEIEAILPRAEKSDEAASIDEQIARLQKESDSDIARTKLLALRDEIQNLMASLEPEDESSRIRLNTTLDHLEKAEVLLIQRDFDPYVVEVRTWHEQRRTLEKAASLAGFKKVGELSFPMSQHAQQGLKLAERASIFQASGIADATLVNDTLLKACGRLSRSAEWVYNQEALTVLHEIRDNHPPDISFRSSRLVTVDPSRLNAVVLRRYNQEFHYLFNELSDESKALELMKQMTLESLK